MNMSPLPSFPHIFPFVHSLLSMPLPQPLSYNLSNYLNPSFIQATFSILFQSPVSDLVPLCSLTISFYIYLICSYRFFLPQMICLFLLICLYFLPFPPLSPFFYMHLLCYMRYMFGLVTFVFYQATLIYSISTRYSILLPTIRSSLFTLSIPYFLFPFLFNFIALLCPFLLDRHLLSPVLPSRLSLIPL